MLHVLDDLALRQASIRLRIRASLACTSVAAAEQLIATRFLRLGILPRCDLPMAIESLWDWKICFWFRTIANFLYPAKTSKYQNEAMPTAIAKAIETFKTLYESLEFSVWVASCGVSVTCPLGSRVAIAVLHFEGVTASGLGRVKTPTTGLARFEAVSKSGAGGYRALIAAIGGLMPTMLITRVRL